MTILDGGAIQGRPGGGGRPGRSPEEVRSIERQAMVKAAAEFAASRPDMKAADVLRVAQAWYEWVHERTD